MDVIASFEMLLKLRGDPDELCPRLLTFAEDQFASDRAEQERKLLEPGGGAGFDDEVSDGEDTDDEVGAGAASAGGKRGAGAAEAGGEPMTDDERAAAAVDAAAREDLFGSPNPSDGGDDDGGGDTASVAGASGGDDDGDDTPTKETAAERSARRAARSAARAARKPAAPFVKFLRRGNATVLFNLREWLGAYTAMCVAPADGVDPTSEGLHPEKQRLATLAAAASGHLAGCLQRTIGSYLARFAALFELELELELNSGGESNLEMFAAALAVVAQGGLAFQQIGKAPAAEFIRVSTTCVRQLCRVCGERLQKGFAEKVAELATFKRKAPLAEVSKELDEWVAAETATAFEGLQNVRWNNGESDAAETNSFFAGEFQDRCVKQGVVQSLLAFMFEHALSYARQPSQQVDKRPLPPPPTLEVGGGDGSDGGRRQQKAAAMTGPPQLALVLSHFCESMAGSGILRLVALASKYFSTMTSPEEDDDDDTDTDQLAVMQRAADARRAAAVLVARFVDDESEKVADKIRTALGSQDLLRARKPTAVSAAIQLAVQQFSSAAAMAQSLYGGRGKGASLLDPREKSEFVLTQAKGAGGGGGGGGGLGGAVQSSAASLMSSMSMSQLFTEHTEIFSTIDSEGGSIMFAMVKRVVKTYIEQVRLGTYGGSGFQQVELDANFLGKSLWDFARTETEQNFLQSAIGQAVLSAENRCVEEPIHLGPDELDQLVDSEA
jgi:hypothetical protein